MGNKKDILELNGKKYNARTGELIGEPASAPKIRSANVEGFVKPHSSQLPLRTPPTPLRHKPERARTLMRHVVAKPTATATSDKKPQLITNQIRTLNDFRRQKRAGNLSKSQLVQKFNTAPNASPPVAIEHSVRARKVPATAATPREQIPRPTEDPFERVMRQSRSHDQNQLKRQRFHQRLAAKFRVAPRVISASAFVVAILLLGSFFAYQNASNLSVRYAAMRADVNGKLPAYQPAGFALHGGVKYSPGQISLNYRSNTDDRAFSVIQKTSNWDSATLLNEYVATNQNLVQTVEDNGKTIYVYGENNATWVDNGVWYQVEDQAALSSDQLLRIARSL